MIPWLVVIVAAIGAALALFLLVRILRKGGSHGTRTRAAAERLDLFPPVVDARTVQRTDAVSEPIAVSDGHTFAESLRNAEPDSLADLRTVVDAHPHADRRAVIDAYHRGFRNGVTAAEAEFQRVIVSSSERRSAVLRNGPGDV